MVSRRFVDACYVSHDPTLLGNNLSHISYPETGFIASILNSEDQPIDVPSVTNPASVAAGRRVAGKSGEVLHGAFGCDQITQRSSTANDSGEEYSALNCSYVARYNSFFSLYQYWTNIQPYYQQYCTDMNSFSSKCPDIRVLGLGLRNSETLISCQV